MFDGGPPFLAKANDDANRDAKAPTHFDVRTDDQWSNLVLKISIPRPVARHRVRTISRVKSSARTAVIMLEYSAVINKSFLSEAHSFEATMGALFSAATFVQWSEAVRHRFHNHGL